MTSKCYKTVGAKYLSSIKFQIALANDLNLIKQIFPNKHCTKPPY